MTCSSLERLHREIGTIEHVSTSTVSKVFNEFVGVVEDSSIIKATEEYNVRDRVDGLLELSAEAKKAKTSIPRLLSAARLMSFMNSCGLKPSQLRSYLEMCDKHRENIADFAFPKPQSSSNWKREQANHMRK